MWNRISWDSFKSIYCFVLFFIKRQSDWSNKFVKIQNSEFVESCGEHLNHEHLPKKILIWKEFYLQRSIFDRDFTSWSYELFFFSFFFLSVYLLYIFYLDFYLPFPFGLLFSFPIIWTFISLLYLDFYIPLLFGLFLKKSFFFNYFFLFNRSHILDFFQKILLEIIE